MKAEQLEIFTHGSAAKPRVIEGAESEILQSLLMRAGVIMENEPTLLVFVGEWDQALREVDEIEDGADEHHPADTSKTLHELELHRHRAHAGSAVVHVRIAARIGKANRRRDRLALEVGCSRHAPSVRRPAKGARAHDALGVRGTEARM